MIRRYKDKYRSANNLDDIVLASTNYINEDLNHTRKDNFKEFARGDVLIRVGSNDYSAEVIVGLTSANNMVLYDIIKFTPQKFTLKQKKMKAHNTAMNQNGSGSDRKGVPSSDTTVTQGNGNVNTHSMQKSKNNSSFSVSDSNGNQLSDSDRLNELQSEYRELEKKVDKIKASDEYKRLLDIISTGEGDALDEAVKEYGKFTHSSGLYAVTKRMSEITGEQKDLRAKIDSANEQSRDEFMRSVDKLTDRQKAEYAQKAVDTFGTTERVDLASYILTNGEMLDFSEGQGYRIKDHREISEILDMPDSAEYSDSLIYFMNMGNIRMQTYGIDISAAPNAEQISRLRVVIPEIMKDNDEFSVDFSKKNG